MDAQRFAGGLLTQALRSIKMELGSDAPRIAALRLVRKFLRRLPLGSGLTDADKCGSYSEEKDKKSDAGSMISVESVWKLLMDELRHGHPTRKSKSMGMIEAILKVKTDDNK